MTVTLYKLTDRDGYTRRGLSGETLWSVGFEPPPLPGNSPLCSPAWYHAYSDPLVAVFMNPIHAQIDSPRLWQIEAPEIGIDDNGLKCGVRSCRIVAELPVPTMTDTQRVAAAILCAQTRKQSATWTKWATAWLDASDRSEAAASAAWAAEEAAWASAPTSLKRFAIGRPSSRGSRNIANCITAGAIESGPSIRHRRTIGRRPFPRRATFRPTRLPCDGAGRHLSCVALAKQDVPPAPS